METIENLFVTPVYKAPLGGDHGAALRAQLEALTLSLAEDDAAGQAWCDDNDYPGYTSYGSLNDLPWRFPEFKSLQTAIDTHVVRFADHVQFDLDGRALSLENMWVNLLVPGGHHAAHIHPHSVVSGTYYVTLPEGAASIRFEDPRLAMMMAAPPRRTGCDRAFQSFVKLAPSPGDVVLWESWLRHDVPINNGDDDRISISFNYAWSDA